MGQGDNDQNASSESKSAKPGDADSPRKRTCCQAICGLLTYLNFIKLMKFVGSLACAAIFGIIGYAFTDYPSISTTSEVALVIAYGFHMLTALVQIFAIFEVELLLTQIKLLESWVVLGIFQVYLADLVLSTVSYNSQLSDDITKSIQVSSYTLAIVGVLFVLIGAIGGKGLQHRKEEELLKKAEV